MKILFSMVLYFLVSYSVAAQESTPKNFTVGSEFSTMVDSLQYEKKNISMTAENGDVVSKSLQDLEEELKRGAGFYKVKDYKKAYPTISELSQWGVKEAQAILGDMYIKGEHVDQSIELGLAWLGVAKEGGTVRSARKSFDYVYNQLNDQQKAYMDTKISKHIAKYGAEAQNFSCKSRTVTGSNIPKTRCLKIPGSNSTLYPI
jgi:hypothetical protein